VIDWRKYNSTTFRNILEKECSVVKWDEIKSIEVLNREILTCQSLAMNKLIPKRTVRLRRVSDISSYRVEALKKKRDRLLKNARSKNCDKLWTFVKDLNKEIKRVVKEERQNIIKCKMKDSSPQTFWRTVSSQLGRVNTLDEFPLCDDGHRIPEEEIPDVFGDYFVKKVETLLAGTNCQATAEPTITLHYLNEFTPLELETAVKSFKPKKSFGPDDVPLVVFKDSLPVMGNQILKLFNLIVVQGRIPDGWRLARIKPILKKGDPSQVINYRPISNLNSISKAYERCLLNRLPLDAEGLNQHGFKRHHSTTSAALEIQSVLAEKMDQGLKCLIYSVDLSAAFDLIQPNVFIQKILSSGKINHQMANLLYDLLKGRKAYVEAGEHQSATIAFPVGCPQGSTLGPKIFNLYCADLIDSISEGHLVSYADDSYVIVSAKDEQQLVEKTKSVLKNHIKWLKDNGMVCNVSKTEVMVMNSSSLINLDIDGHQITSSNCMKVLGIVFDDALSWTTHVEKTTAKCARMLHGLKHIRRTLNLSQAKQVITSYFFSVLFYGCEVWYHKHLSFFLKQRVRSAHYRALRLVFGKRLTRDEIDMISGRASPDEWSNYALAKTVIQTVKAMMPCRLYVDLMSNSYSERRSPGRLFFHDDSARKIGRQVLKNRLSVLSRQIKFDWLNNMSPDLIRINLKKSFFHYSRAH